MTEPSERTMLRKEGDKTKMNIDKIKVKTERIKSLNNGPWLWSSGQCACLPISNPATVFSAKFVFEKKENKQKEVGLAHFLKKSI